MDKKMWKYSKCPKCGSVYFSDFKFCPKCGTELNYSLINKR